jgi:glyoxylase-like metal-dependent hydrolase (beta-lactamase superfamily II)
VFETLSGRRTIGRGARAVEVLDVGPTSHAAAMLAVYVPAEKLLFQGDLLRINEHGGPVVSPDANRDLDSIIRRFRLDVRTIGAVHGLNGTVEDLREAIRRGATAQ